MTILLTGGAGYLGTVLLRQILHTTDHAVVVVDRLDWGAQPYAAVIQPSARVTLITADLRGIEEVGSADAVIHLAAVVGYPACAAAPDDATQTNIVVTRRLAAQMAGRPFLFASTGSCYGRLDGFATEETPIAPLSLYAQTKADAEQAVLAAGGVCLRLATLYGPSPRMRWDLLPHDFARRAVAERTLALYEPEAARTFLHVEDAASAFLHALQVPSGIYNVGDSAQNLTKRQLAEHIQALTDCTITETAGQDVDQRDYAVDFSKFTATGWCPSPQTGLAQTLPQIVALARCWV